ncbi:hypothetical protein BC834DRAFT_891167 [Gloeopeniophorella convolvens]|nr:hypothetical protein BC834DRAFT_891167 [Gloeopeniophorella convolvens]
MELSILATCSRILHMLLTLQGSASLTLRPLLIANIDHLGQVGPAGGCLTFAAPLRSSHSIIIIIFLPASFRQIGRTSKIRPCQSW